MGLQRSRETHLHCLCFCYVKCYLNRHSDSPRYWNASYECINLNLHCFNTAMDHCCMWCSDCKMWIDWLLFDLCFTFLLYIILRDHLTSLSWCHLQKCPQNNIHLIVYFMSMTLTAMDYYKSKLFTYRLLVSFLLCTQRKSTSTHSSHKIRAKNVPSLTRTTSGRFVEWWFDSLMLLLSVQHAKWSISDNVLL